MSATHTCLHPNQKPAGKICWNTLKFESKDIYLFFPNRPGRVIICLNRIYYYKNNNIIIIFPVLTLTLKYRPIHLEQHWDFASCDAAFMPGAGINMRRSISEMGTVGTEMVSLQCCKSPVYAHERVPATRGHRCHPLCSLCPHGKGTDATLGVVSAHMEKAPTPPSV